MLREKTPVASSEKVDLAIATNTLYGLNGLGLKASNLPLAFSPQSATVFSWPASANSTRLPAQLPGTAQRKQRSLIALCPLYIGSVIGFWGMPMKLRMSRRKRSSARGKRYQTGSRKQSSRRGHALSRSIYAATGFGKKSPSLWRLFRSGWTARYALMRNSPLLRQVPVLKGKLRRSLSVRERRSAFALWREWAILRRQKRWKSVSTRLKVFSEGPAAPLKRRSRKERSNDGQ